MRCSIALLGSAGACGEAGGVLGDALTGLEGTGGEGAGTDSASASAGDTGEPPPQDEGEGDFRVPRASGRFVYSASTVSDSVAVIDSSNLAIDVVAVGRGPTVVVPIAGGGSDEGRVAVLDQGSNDLALLATTSDFTTAVTVREVTAGANNLAVSPDGAYVFVYHDVDGPEAQGPGSDQELTVLAVASDASHAMTVGAHPREVVFSSDAMRAYVITDDGVNVVPLDALGMLDKPDVIPVVSDPAVDPSTVEVHVAADRDVALSRVEGEREIVATDLVTRAQYAFSLPDIPTDLDLAQDGSFAILTTPSVHGSRFYELPLPVDGSTTPQPYGLPSEYVGLAQLSPQGDALVLYSRVNPFGDEAPAAPGLQANRGGVAGGSTGGSSGTAGGSSSGSSSSDGSSSDGSSSSGGGDTGPSPDEDPRQRVSLVRRDETGAWGEAVTLFVDDPIATVGIAPDGNDAMLLHEASTTVQPAWSYTLVDLSKPFPVKKRQMTEASPGPVLFTPEGDRALVLLRDDEQGVQRIDLVDLRTFIVDALELGSPPEGAGYVDATDKAFVSQEHPTGRITFVAADGSIETVTGFRLNDAVKD
ncbi:MAG: hypothetical protein K1X88_10075 [Nannocystaceae bacterium]|nr:hypothetical protein [Nannocystaceae bacterium]